MPEYTLTRAELSQFLPSQRAVLAFESLLNTANNTVPGIEESSDSALYTADNAQQLAIQAINVIAVLLADMGQFPVVLATEPQQTECVFAPSHQQVIGYNGTITAADLTTKNLIVRNGVIEDLR